jgi:hypothetical protein
MSRLPIRRSRRIPGLLPARRPLWQSCLLFGNGYLIEDRDDLDCCGHSTELSTHADQGHVKRRWPPGLQMAFLVNLQFFLRICPDLKLEFARALFESDQTAELVDLLKPMLADKRRPSGAAVFVGPGRDGALSLKSDWRYVIRQTRLSASGSRRSIGRQCTCRVGCTSSTRSCGHSDGCRPRDVIWVQTTMSIQDATRVTVRWKDDSPTARISLAR